MYLLSEVDEPRMTYFLQTEIPVACGFKWSIWETAKSILRYLIFREILSLLDMYWQKICPHGKDWMLLSCQHLLREWVFPYLQTRKKLFSTPNVRCNAHLFHTQVSPQHPPWASSQNSLHDVYYSITTPQKYSVFRSHIERAITLCTERTALLYTKIRLGNRVLSAKVINLLKR